MYNRTIVHVTETARTTIKVPDNFAGDVITDPVSVAMSLRSRFPGLECKVSGLKKESENGTFQGRGTVKLADALDDAGTVVGKEKGRKSKPVTAEAIKDATNAELLPAS